MVLAHDLSKGNRTTDIQITQDVTFDSMLLSPNTLQGLKTAGFYKPSPIQLHGIPLGKCGFDLLLEAKSGTGKTAVFTVIALEKIDLTKGLQVIMLAPTREIAAQICDVIKQIGNSYTDLKVEVVMGGLPIHEDIMKFKKKVHIIVGSPGRLLHLIKDKHVNMSAVRLVVLDEADKLMDKSFVMDIDAIIKYIPRQKQVILSSATYPEECRAFIQKYIKNAQHICPDTTSVLIGIKQKVTTVKHHSNVVRQTQDRFEELLKIITSVQFKQCLIFCNYQARVAELYKLLKKAKWPAEQLYGQQDQTDRLDALKTLQEYKCRILIATDLAARGIDASNVDLVINFEAPYEWQTYLHRIGRAGRYGSYGSAVTILNNGKEKENFEDMVKSLNVSLGIVDFWTNETIISVNEGIMMDSLSCEKGPITNFVENNNNTKDCKEDLWKVLTEDCYGEKKVVESFENLQKTLAEALTTQVESLEILMQSLQSSEDIVTEEPYKHVRMFQVSNKIESIENFDENWNIAENTDKYGTNQNTDSQKPYEYQEHFTNEYNECQHNSITNEMLSLGLPTSFGKSRKQNNRTYNNYKKIYDGSSSSEDEFYETYTPNKYNCRKKLFKSSSRVEKKDLDSNVNQSRFSNGKKYSNNRMKDSEEYNKNTSNILYNESKQCNNRHGSRQEERQRNRDSNYTNWYNHIKMVTKQLEMTLYIEELSKL